MQVLLENAISPWRQFWERILLKHSFILGTCAINSVKTIFNFLFPKVQLNSKLWGFFSPAVSEKSSFQVFDFLIRNVIEERVGKIPHLSLVASHGELYFPPLVASPPKGKNPILSSYPSFNSMAFPVVEFSRQGYKIRNVFG